MCRFDDGWCLHRHCQYHLNSFGSYCWTAASSPSSESTNNRLPLLRLLPTCPRGQCCRLPRSHPSNQSLCDWGCGGRRHYKGFTLCRWSANEQGMSHGWDLFPACSLPKCPKSVPHCPSQFSHSWLTCPSLRTWRWCRLNVWADSSNSCVQNSL